MCLGVTGLPSVSGLQAESSLLQSLGEVSTFMSVSWEEERCLKSEAKVVLVYAVPSSGAEVVLVHPAPSSLELR